jgi:hypothetical protein
MHCRCFVQACLGSYIAYVCVASCRHAWVGRFAIIFMALVGTLPLLAGPSALDATTISGTMVVGLGPPVNFDVPRLALLLGCAFTAAAD